MKRQVALRFVWLVAIFIAGVSPAFAAPHEVRVPLHNGKLHVPDLTTAICREIHIPKIECAGGDIDLTTLQGSQWIRGINAAMGDGCAITAGADALTLRVDPEKLPRDVRQIKRSIRVFTATVAPEAAAAQAQHWGIFLPAIVDERLPLVLLIHGLDSEKQDLFPLGQMLESAGYQVGYFAYPDDQPIDDSARFLAEKMSFIRQRFPATKIDMVAHSMGGLVARAYVDGREYQGGVDHLILIGTPNEGSKWAAGRFLLEINEQYHDWKQDPQWRWTWAITDGLGEAGSDLKPHSEFLKRLNSLPRRSGVRYTIVAGNQPLSDRVSAVVADTAVRAVPKRASKWWGFRQCVGAIEHCGDKLRHKSGDGDGPVTLQSARLAGVTDFVIVPADHGTLIYPDHGSPPVALPVILDRLKD